MNAAAIRNFITYPKIYLSTNYCNYLRYTTENIDQLLPRELVEKTAIKNFNNDHDQSKRELELINKVTVNRSR